jgi:hypothetical protein
MKSPGRWFGLSLVLCATRAFAQAPPAPPPPIHGPGDVAPPITPPPVVPPPGRVQVPGPPMPPPTVPDPHASSGAQPEPAPPPPSPLPEPQVQPPLPVPYPQPPYPPPYPPPAWQPPPYGWPQVEEPEPRREEDPGLRYGIPYDYAGMLALETAAYSNGNELTTASMLLAARVPLSDAVFFLGRVPFGLTVAGNDSTPVIGNLGIGVGGVADIGDRVWLSLAGTVGIPLVNARAYSDDIGIIGPMIPRAYWNIHDYYPNVFPIWLHAGVEGHAGSIVILRAMLEPVLMPPFEVGDRGRDDAEFEFTLQHAAEIQIGHDVGGGLRIQGMAMPTYAETTYGLKTLEEDLYQFAFEPFFAVQHDKLSFRFGVVLPVDGKLGPPFSGTWGGRLNFGIPL